uniref:Uncharacterized protein n=2 Tax=Panagrolaimus TaxID=55784 RepID=A0A914Q7R2_9BILA
MALTAVGQIVSDQDSHFDESDVLAREILLTSPFCILLQVLMLYSGIKFRNYARRKEAHDHTIHSINPVLSFQNAVSPTASFDISEDKC